MRPLMTSSPIMARIMTMQPIARSMCALLMCLPSQHGMKRLVPKTGLSSFVTMAAGLHPGRAPVRYGRDA